MKKLSVVTIGGLALAFAMLLSLAPASAGETVSLRGSSGIPDNIAAPVLFKTEEATKLFARAFKGAPPQIPHITDENDKKYMITMKQNGCLECHDKSVDDKPKVPKASTGHYTGSDSVIRDKVFGARYYCMQCHVPQMQTKPLVGNTFKAAN